MLMLHHVMHWILDFLGINNTYDSFSTHMYNFWSGFGSNIGILAIVTTVIGVYRHNLQADREKDHGYLQGTYTFGSAQRPRWRYERD
jgi:hypothetical protein